jgi:hypothetical protein
VEVYPVAAAASVAAALLGPRRSATVVAGTRHAVYVSTPDSGSPAICLATPGAIRLPCALVLGGGAPLPAVRVGDDGRVGGGELVLGGVGYRPVRWWRPPRPRTSGAPPDVDPPPLDAATGAAAAELAGALAGDAPLARPVAALLGRGPGLTPLGDDVLAGALVALVAAGSPTGARLAEQVRQTAFRRTTFVSAALLWHAAQGECVPELAAVLAGAPGAPAALLRVGASSGTGLAHGIRAARTALREVAA